MEETQKNNPLHGQTLEQVLRYLLMNYTWQELDQLIRINCFHSNQSVASSLKFLRRTEWARKKVEKLFVDTLKHGKIV